MKALGALRDVRVLDFTWVAAGPTGTLLLAMAGADVIKVESGARLDNYRKSFGADGDVNRSMLFAGVNVGKRSIVVDAKSPEGRDLLLDLVPHVDVVTENFTPGVMERLGLGYDAMRERNDQIIVVSSSAAGQTGPKRSYSGFASIFAAQGGLAGITRRADGALAQFGRSIDSRVGTVVAIAALLGLRLREQTGHGCHLDIAGQEVVAALIGDVVCGAAPATGAGRCHATADGWVYVEGADDQPETDVDLVCAELLRSDAAEALRSVGLGAWPVPEMSELTPHDDPLPHPWDDTIHALMDRVVSVGSPIQWPAEFGPTKPMRPAPLLGEHTDEVLAELLGAGAPVVDAARAAGVLR